jgi:hypothetical protein
MLGTVNAGQELVGSVAEMDMRTVILGMAGCITALVWLALLEVTDFNAAAVGAGLLAVLSVTGRMHQHRV